MNEPRVSKGRSSREREDETARFVGMSKLYRISSHLCLAFVLIVLVYVETKMQLLASSYIPLTIPTPPLTMNDSYYICLREKIHFYHYIYSTANYWQRDT